MAGSKSQTGAPANAVPAGPGHEQEPKEIKAATPPYSDFPKRHGRSLSHWLAIVQGDPLLAHRTTDDLPSSADIVVIGSGVSQPLSGIMTDGLMPLTDDRDVGDQGLPGDLA